MKLRLCPSRRGIALPAAIVTLTIMALFVAGSAFFTLQEVRAGRNQLTDRAALEAAEYGAQALARDWQPAWALSLPIGGSIGPFSYTLGGGATATARLTRATLTTFWGVADGTAGLATRRTEARHTIAVIFRLALALPSLRAALTVRDSAEVSGGGSVIGTDSLVAGPVMIRACTIAGTPAAGIASPDSTRVCDGACGVTSGNIIGTPPLMSDPVAGDSLHYLQLGDRAWSQLATGADVVVPPNAIVTPGPVLAGGACQRGATGNWGDPGGASACASYYPIIWAQGDVTLNGGAGQGILIADGDVSIGAGARFAGLVVARDDIVTLAGGGAILGAALANDARPGGGDHTQIGGGGMVRYSGCALEAALYASASLIRIRQRAWAEF